MFIIFKLKHCFVLLTMEIVAVSSPLLSFQLFALINFALCVLLHTGLFLLMTSSGLCMPMYH